MDCPNPDPTEIAEFFITQHKACLLGKHCDQSFDNVLAIH